MPFSAHHCVIGILTVLEMKDWNNVGLAILK